MSSIINNQPWNIVCDSNIFKRRSFACDIYKDRYFVIAGGWEGETTRSAAIYDVVTNQYDLLPELPYASHCRGVIVSDYFYVIVKEALGHGNLYRLSLSERLEWEHIVSLDTIKILTDDTHIFLISWNWKHGIEITVHNPKINDLSPVIRKPYGGGDSFKTVLVDKKIYIIGGSRNNRMTDNTYIFDIVTQSWSQAPPLPRRLHNQREDVIGKSIFVSGGNLFDYKTLNVYVFDIVAQSWSQLPLLPTQLKDPALFAIDRCFIVSGITFNWKRNECSHTFILDTKTQQWTETNIALSMPQDNHDCVKVGSQIITLGGKNPIEWKFCPMTSIHIKDISLGYVYWLMLKPYILLRKLVDDKRAAPIIVTANTNATAIANKEAIVQKLFTDILPLDTFRYVLTFL